MINFATVHWGSADWIDVQLRELERHTGEPYRVWAFVSGLGAFSDERFHYVNTLAIRQHSWKLNLLGDLIAAGAEADELIVFIDGDAFPVAPLAEYLRARLDGRPLVAVQRRENLGDPQPHPCFAATTVGLWRRLGGDWRDGPTWRNSRGEEVSDVGARLWAELERQGIEWTPMLRSNRRDLHPLMFGVYDDVVYHHGGGFRAMAGGRAWRGEKAARLAARPSARLLDLLPHGPRANRLRERFHPVRRYRARLAAEVKRGSDEVFELIRSDGDLAGLLLNPGYGGPLAERRLPVEL